MKQILIFGCKKKILCIQANSFIILMFLLVTSKVLILKYQTITQHQSFWLFLTEPYLTKTFKVCQNKTIFYFNEKTFFWSHLHLKQQKGGWNGGENVSWNYAGGGGSTDISFYGTEGSTDWSKKNLLYFFFNSFI